jgi:transcription antitermination factor NusG
MNNFEPGWRVIYTKPRHEKRVAEQLEQLAIDPFLPSIKKLHHWSDRRKYIDAPLFPSYVFVYLCNDRHYFQSLEVEGVLHYVRIGREVVRVRESIIDHIRVIIRNGKDIEVLSDDFRPGRQLHIKEGPFTGFACEVVEYKGKEKILVRIDLLQRSILLNLPCEYLMADNAALTC